MSHPRGPRVAGLNGLSLTELASNPEVVAEVERAVAATNEHFSHVEQIKRFVVLGDEWLPDSEELTPTMKLKRRGVHAKYAAQIATLYDRRPANRGGACDWRRQVRRAVVSIWAISTWSWPRRRADSSARDAMSMSSPPLSACDG